MVNSYKEEQEQNKELSNKLFYRVWCNIVIFKNIFRFVRLYKKNEKVTFKSRKELLEYPEREFIQSLVFSSGNLLEVGDLPIGCVLKDVELTSFAHTDMHGSKIPYGVENLKFPWAGNNRSIPRTQISTFPSSLKTLYGIFLGYDRFKVEKEKRLANKKKKLKKIKEEKEEKEIKEKENEENEEEEKNEGIEEKEEEEEEEEEEKEKEEAEEAEEEEEEEKEEGCFTIPSNINSVYLNDSPNISGVNVGRGYVQLSKGLKDLSFDCYWDNDGVYLRKGDLPDGIEILSMSGYQLKSIANKEILPNSIIDLSISYGIQSCMSQLYDKDCNEQPITFDVLPPNIELLYINNHCAITKDSLLYKCTSIKTLHIYNGEFYPLLYEAGSLPPNITTLYLDNFRCKLVVDVIPFGVKDLELSGVKSDSIEIGAIPSSVQSLSMDYFITNPEIFPPSLNHLKYSQSHDEDIPDHQYLSYFSLLPKSITSLTLDPSFKDINLNFPPSITEINYINS
ncbi:hypothetical protein ACTA71_008966 [Dictyostelium dimigraforme]